MRRLLTIALLGLMAASVLNSPAQSQTKAPPSTDGKDRRVVILNQRSTDMLRLYGARNTTDSWEENILLTPIPSGGKRLINFDDGTGSCQFDFRAVFKDDVSAHMFNINVCRESYWVVTDD